MKRFNWQIFISINLVFTFLVMVVSGIILYFKPEGSIARWLDWDMLGLTKPGWESVHTVFSFLFMVFAFFHILDIHLANISKYLSKNRGRNSSREVKIAILISVVFLAGTTYQVPPFNLVFQAGNNLSDAWAERVVVKHEAIDVRQNIDEVALEMGLNKENLVELLERNGYDISLQQSLQENARNNAITPYELYSMILEKSSTMKGNKGQAVYRQITLEMMAVILDIPVAELVDFAGKKYKMEDIGKETSLLDIAYHSHQEPSGVKQTLMQYSLQ